MIRGYIPGFARPTRETRYGDAQVITDGTYTLVIDGMCGAGARKLISWLKKNKIRKLYILITHWHDDHFAGIEMILNDSYFTVVMLICPNPVWLKPGLGGYYSSCVQECIDDGNRIISLAKKKGAKISMPVSGKSYRFGDIRFKVYKKQPQKVEKDDTNAWTFVNDGSLSTWFHQVSYWSSGDGSGPEGVKKRIQGLNLTGKVKLFKIDHHGGCCTESESKFMKEQGADFCWYNDLEPHGIGSTGFTAYGARRCKQAGIKVFESVGDINWIAQRGKVSIYKDFKTYRYTCGYKGKSTLKGANRSIAQDVIDGKYGNDDERMTNLLDAGYYPVAVQMLVNKMLKEK